MTTIDKLNKKEETRLNELIEKTVNPVLLKDDLFLLEMNPKQYWDLFDVTLPCSEERRKLILFMQYHYKNQ